MSYEAPTVEQFRIKYPEFTEALYSDETVTLWLTDANRSVDETWLEGDYQNAIMALAAHNLNVASVTASSLGQDPIKALSVGPLSLTFGDKVNYKSYSSTPYGQYFQNLMRLNHPPIAFVF